MVFIIKNLSRKVPRAYRMRRKVQLISGISTPVFAAFTGQVLLSLSDPVKQKQNHLINGVFYGIGQLFLSIPGRGPLTYPMWFGDLISPGNACPNEQR